MNEFSRSKFSERAILLYGPRKSGSSLLVTLLDGGQELLMLPGELKLKPHVREQIAPEDRIRRYLERGRKDLTRLIELEADDNDIKEKPGFAFENLTVEQTREIFDVARYVTGLSTLLQREAMSIGDLARFDVELFASCIRVPHKEYSCWAAKEIGGADSAQMLALFRREFPAGRVVLQTRDPLYIVRSIILERKRRGIRLSNRAVWDECCQAQDIIQFTNDQIGREIISSYEELTQNTEGEMRRLAAALEIPFEPILCQPTTLGVSVVVRTSSQKTTTVFRQESSWRKDLNSANIAVMSLFEKTAAARYRKRGQKYVPYQEFRARLKGHNADAH